MGVAGVVGPLPREMGERLDVHHHRHLHFRGDVVDRRISGESSATWNFISPMLTAPPLSASRRTLSASGTVGSVLTDLAK